MDRSQRIPIIFGREFGFVYTFEGSSKPSPSASVPLSSECGVLRRIYATSAAKRQPTGPNLSRDPRHTLTARQKRRTAPQHRAWGRNWRAYRTAHWHSFHPSGECVCVHLRPYPGPRLAGDACSTASKCGRVHRNDRGTLRCAVRVCTHTFSWQSDLTVHINAHWTPHRQTHTQTHTHARTHHEYTFLNRCVSGAREVALRLRCSVV